MFYYVIKSQCKIGNCDNDGNDNNENRVILKIMRIIIIGTIINLLGILRTYQNRFFFSSDPHTVYRYLV